jgi:hypothetical protein
MAEDGDSERIVELASESVAPIEQELRQRLALALTDKESLAIETALLKAFINGMRTGSAETAERVVDGVVQPTGLGGRHRAARSPAAMAGPVGRLLRRRLTRG